MREKTQRMFPREERQHPAFLTACLPACLPAGLPSSLRLTFNRLARFFFFLSLERRGGEGWTSYPGTAAPRSVLRVRGPRGTGRGSRPRVRTKNREEEKGAEEEEQEESRQLGLNDEGWARWLGWGVSLSNSTQTVNK